MTVEGPPHKTLGPGYLTHAWDCDVCVALSEYRAVRDEEQNPHRPGTKAHAKYDRERSAARWALDMRGETYWSS